MVNDQEYNKKFAERFKYIRTKNGYTQQQMANLFNVTRPCICYWENGKRVPDYLKLVEICRFFDISSDYLLGVSDADTKIFKENNKNYNSNDFIDISRLSDEYKRQIRDYFSYLLEKQMREEAKK